jgi:putative two-component system response regulator
MDTIEESATVMVVDDTPENLNLLRDMLQGTGYKVLAFPDGRMFLNAVTKHPPDLILLDINMPGMDGFEVCKHIKADERLREIPVLFISALTEVTDKVKAFEAGGVDYITKPFQFEEVRSRVGTHLRLSKMKLLLEQHNLHLQDLVIEKTQEIFDSQMATVLALSKLAEYRDDETGHHIERTRTFCKVLAQQLQHNPRYSQSISDDYVENIFHVAPLHDIGKVGIPDSILLKPGRLTPEEFGIIKSHPVIGANTLKSVRTKYPNNVFINMGIAVAHSHHEKWDGSGYPDGLAGEDIPLAGRIMSLADVYDALRSKRPYKLAFSHEESCSIILKGAGKHFDPAVIAAFKDVESMFAEIHKHAYDGEGEVLQR